jgi:hypothetical protein
VIYEVEGVADGWAFYWEDNQQWAGILMALRAGQLAQLKQFPDSEFRGGQRDVQNFFSMVQEHFLPSSGGDVWQDISTATNRKLDTHWATVESVADAAMKATWIPVTVAEHPDAKRKKHLDGNTLVEILAKHKITTRVR